MMEDKERDKYLLEILDRLARLETKFDEQVGLKLTAREALDKANDTSKEIIDIKRRLDENDNKWRTDRSEKWGLWLAIVAGIFAIGATLLGSLL